MFLVMLRIMSEISMSLSGGSEARHFVIGLEKLDKWL
jgi:hypothetical protein